MDEPAAEPVGQVVEGVYRSESRRVLATLIRLIGDFHLAEESLQEAFALAKEQWLRGGVPASWAGKIPARRRFSAFPNDYQVNAAMGRHKTRRRMP